MSRKVSRASHGSTNRPMTVSDSARRREGAQLPTPQRLAPIPSKEERLHTASASMPRARTAMSFEVGRTTKRSGAQGLRASMPELGEMESGRGKHRTRSVSVAAGEEARYYGKQGGGGRPQRLSEELRVIQKKLHEGGGVHFDKVQDHFWQNSRPSVGGKAIKVDGEKGGEDERPRQPAADREQLSAAIKKSIDVDVSPKVLDEVMGLCSRPDGNDGKIKYRDFARLMWDDEVHEQLQDKPLPFKIGAKSEMHPVRHLFLPLRSAGFYNDNVQPRATIFGVKKGYSSVRYDMFSNGPRDRSVILSQVEPRVLQAVESSMGFERLPSRHHVTMRPLDPYLTYLTVGQGRKDIQPRPTPINVLTSNPRQDIPLPKEWKKLSTMTFAFTHNQSGSLHGPLQNRLF